MTDRRFHRPPGGRPRSRLALAALAATALVVPAVPPAAADPATAPPAGRAARTQEEQRPHREEAGLDCTLCHECPNPTFAAPCLKACPRRTSFQSAGPHDVAEAPGDLVLDGLADQYAAVHFDHRRHAGMSEMNQGCTICHHFCPPGEIPPCRTCHAIEASEADLRQPSLKGAYHRQCLNCHREWSHDTDCNVCHLPQVKASSAASASDPTDIIGRAHPVIQVPQKRLYHTPYQPGPLVTFYHQEHIDLFGLRCVDCHQKETCSYCHDLQKTASQRKSMEQVHAICSSCHETDQCSQCHDTKERPAFSHASTGWPIGRFHAALECRACHPTGRRISKVNRACPSCHGGWNQENFRHAVTGLQLDETHLGADCADCHPDRAYDAKPTCEGCHDDGRDHRRTPPGAYVKVSGG